MGDICAPSQKWLSILVSCLELGLCKKNSDLAKALIFKRLPKYNFQISMKYNLFKGALIVKCCGFDKYCVIDKQSERRLKSWDLHIILQQMKKVIHVHVIFTCHKMQ